MQASPAARTTETQGSLLPGGRRGGDLFRLGNLMLSFSIKVKHSWKLRVHKCWNLWLPQRQLRDIQLAGKATTISLSSRIILLKEGGDRQCLESGKQQETKSVFGIA